MSKKQAEIREKLLAIIRQAIEVDRVEREKLTIGDKFKFIRDKLNHLHEQVEKAVVSLQEEESAGISAGLAEDEQVIYVHLFNAQGLDITAWKHMVKPDVLYEYSVNRPIYGEKSHIESFISGRPHREQHAYLAVAIKKEHILTSSEEKLDPLGKPLVRIKEGSLHHHRIQGFVHNEREYHVTDQSKLVRKDQ